MKNNSLLLSVFLTAGLLAGCGNIQELPTFPELKVQPTPTPVVATPEPVPTPTPDPATETRSISAVTVNVPVKDMSRKNLDRDGLTAILNRGDEVHVVGIQGKFLKITLKNDPAGTEYYVDSRYVHLSTDEVVNEADGYCDSETRVYRTADFNEEPLEELEKNTEIHLIDMLGDKAYISWKTVVENGSNSDSDVETEMHYGYIEKEKYSDTMFSSGGGWGDSGSWGGGGGGDAGGGGGADGGTIVLSARPQTAVIVATALDYASDSESLFQPCEGTVFSDETPLYICILHRGDTVAVAETDSDYAYILLNHKLFTIPVHALDDGSNFAEWDGYTQPDAIGYQYSDLSDSGDNFETNTVVTVVGEDGDLYIVKTETGFAYIPKDLVSAEEYHHSSGGWGDGGSWGGGGGGDAGGGGADWTAPTM